MTQHMGLAFHQKAQRLKQYYEDACQDAPDLEAAFANHASPQISIEQAQPRAILSANFNPAASIVPSKALGIMEIWNNQVGKQHELSQASENTLDTATDEEATETHSAWSESDSLEFSPPKAGEFSYSKLLAQIEDLISSAPIIAAIALLRIDTAKIPDDLYCDYSAIADDLTHALSGMDQSIADILMYDLARELGAFDDQIELHADAPETNMGIDAMMKMMFAGQQTDGPPPKDPIGLPPSAGITGMIAAVQGVAENIRIQEAQTNLPVMHLPSMSLVDPRQLKPNPYDLNGYTIH